MKDNIIDFCAEKAKREIAYYEDNPDIEISYAAAADIDDDAEVEYCFECKDCGRCEFLITVTYSIICLCCEKIIQPVYRGDNGDV